jgi:hypothetical protein
MVMFTHLMRHFKCRNSLYNCHSLNPKMINASGGFNDQYEVPNNRIAYSRKDLDHTLSLLP